MSHPPHPDSEAALENAAVALFTALDWETMNAQHEALGSNGTLGREKRDEVVLVRYLRPQLQALNPELPTEAIDLAVEELTRSRSTLSFANANQEIYQLLKAGVKVTFKDDEGDERVETVQVIDWQHPTNNHFFLVSQLWVSGEYGNKRADLVGFVNGLPLVFIELKAHHQQPELAYKKNLRDYKQTIPQLFWYNAFLILSNGSKSRIGSITATWEHFSEWKKIDSVGEACLEGLGNEGVVSLDTIIQGTCEKIRLLDLVENFAFFYEAKGSLVKIVAKNHQFLGVNNAIEAVKDIQRNQGKLGVFWHTQGSGKSYSMVFFCQKILRKMTGNWTFLILTDRHDLDEQIYKNFANAGAVTELEKNVRADSASHLQTMLNQEDHRYLFTLIQKFRTEPGQQYPKLSDRADIIVIADEAHRSQYDTYALNLRNALPRAAFIGFTGTPLMAGEERTKEIFGDYVSIYNFRQSVEDGATVPLYYENRIPELELTNDDLNEHMQAMIESALLDEDQEKNLERQCSREYQLIVRDDRLEKIAADIVTHFLGRGALDLKSRDKAMVVAIDRFTAVKDLKSRDKAMVVAIDRFTAVKMYDKVQKYWQQEIDRLKAELQSPLAPLQKGGTEPQVPLAKGDLGGSGFSEFEQKQRSVQLRYLEETDMAVVVSSSQGELVDFQQRGLDITPHRKRLVNESPGLDEKFKDPDNPLRIVFVCAMWMTGFDAPSVSTIYLDKPMKNHTLMQTIARANRVFQNKNNGLIVDYIGVFRNLQEALAIYGSAAGGGVKDGDTPVQPKSALVEALRKAIADALAFCTARGIQLSQLDSTQDTLQRIKRWDEAVDTLADEASRRTFFSLVSAVTRLYKAILPDRAANEFAAIQYLLERLVEKIRSEIGPDSDPDVSDLMGQVGALLDESITAEDLATSPGRAKEATGRYVIHESAQIDLSQLDLEALQARFNTGYKRTEAEKLTSQLNRKLQRMVRLNQTRMDYLERFQQMIEAYNAGARNVEEHFSELIQFARSLDIEDKRAIAENLTEEELTIVDLLTKPTIALSNQEQQTIKRIAKELLEILKREKLVLDWRKRPQTKAGVEVAIKDCLDQLPESYTAELYEQKCRDVYQHIYESYYGQERSIYDSAG